MKNNKNIKLILFAVFLSIEFFCVKNTFYTLLRFNNITNIPFFIIGIGIFFIIYMSLVILRKNYLEETSGTAVINVLKLISIVVLFVILISTINGLISVAVYKSLNSFKDITYIKSLINIVSIIIALLASPILTVLFWNGIKEEKIIMSFTRHLDLKKYFQYICLFIIASAFGLMTSLLAEVFNNYYVSNAISIIVVSFFGSVFIILSEKIYDSKLYLKKIHKKTLSLIIIMALTIQCVCPTVYANNDDSTDYNEYSELDNDDTENDESSESIEFIRDEEKTEISNPEYNKDEVLKMPQDYYYIEEPEGELVAASEDSRTYQISERSFVTQIGGTSFVYEDENGELSLVDNNLEESGDCYENKANDYSVKLPTNITEETGIKINKDGYDIELIPLDGDFSKPATSENAILYNDVFGGIDYQYTVLGDLIKEDIVLNRNVERNTFRFRIKADGLYVSLQDGAIIVTKEKLNDNTDDEIVEPLYTILAPDMTDASGNISNNVNLSLDDSDNSYIATITVDSDWLNDIERAYPVRIDPTINVGSDNIGLYGVEQGSPNSKIGDNNYPYSGYDDGIASSNLRLFHTMHLMTRTYVGVDYDFSQISTEARIDSATFSIYHYTAYSEGTTNFGLYTVDSEWDSGNLTWNNQLDLEHTFVGYQLANPTGGYLNWDIRDVVNSWVNGLSTNNGFVIKAEDENNMQCEVFYNKNGVYKPELTIEWTIPDPVDINYPLDEITVNLRPITEKDIEGKLNFDGVFADGIATPESSVSYSIVPEIEGGISSATTISSLSYKYPDTDLFNEAFPNGTQYKDKLSNYQTGLYTGIPFDTIYKISAQAQKGADNSSIKYSDEFLVYKIKELDTFPYIARYYGVPLDTIMKDNHVHDTLVVENNTIFIRNPKTDIAYTPEEKDEDAMSAVDAALMGRGLHCEYGFEPINLNTGNFYYNTQDTTIADLNGEFSIERTYNSKAISGSSYFGRGWSFYYDEHLSQKADGSIAYKLGDGKKLIFYPNGSGGYLSPEGYNFTLVKDSEIVGTGEDSYTVYTYTISDGDGITRKFNSYGLLTSIEDKGLITTLVYDDSYMLDYIASPSGKIYDITLDDMGRIAVISLPNSSTLRYAYDAAGNLISYTDAAGNTIKYNYDSNHKMTAWYDGNGTRIVKNTYDDKGRVISQTDAEGNTVTLSYSNNQTKVTDANGNVTVYTYDNQYRTTKIEYADGTSVNYTYDSNNNLASDDRYTYAYDSRGNMLTRKRKDGKTQSYTYNSANQVTLFTDYDGSKIGYTYNNGDLTAVTYPDGTKDSYNYNSVHQVISHTDRKGNTENYKYDNAVLTAYTDFNGNTYSYAYDSMNRCITAVAPDGNVSRITYSPNGEITSEISPDGSVTAYTLDKADYVTKITNKQGYVSDFTYNGLGKIKKGTDPRGNYIEYTYDGNGNKKTEKDLNGYITGYEYDCHDRIIKITYAKGESNERTIAYTYDEYDNVLTVKLDNKLIYSYDYDNNTGSLVKVTDAMGNVTSYENDLLGRPVNVEYSDGNKVRYSYDFLGEITEYKDVTGIITKNTYDENGRLIETAINDEIKTTYTYDKNGNLLSKTDALGGLVSYAYDSVNNCISYTDENGAVSEYTYDYMNNIISITNPAKDVSSFKYDKMGNLISKTDYNNAVTEYYYDAAGNMISCKDPLGNITNYSYDKKGQQLSKTDIYGYETLMEYDAYGNIVKIIDASENEIVLSYDNMDNLIKTELSNGDTSRFSYDELGRLVSKTDAAGLKTEYIYDDMNRLIAESDNTGRNEKYKYDKYGRLSEKTDTIGRSIRYEYDKYSNISQITDYDGTVINYAYDLVGNNTEIDTAGLIKQKFEYDPVGNITAYTIGEKKYKYEYDSLNRIISETSPSDIVKEYEYDSMDNLTSSIDGNGIKTAYEYDVVGNLVKLTDGNGGIYTYDYDKLGRMISETTPNESTTEYNYDSLNRITQIRDADGYVTGLDYDLYGNLIETKSARGAVYSYKYDKHNNLISETDALGNTTTYDVDLSGLVKTVTYPNGSKYTYGYDEINRITDIKTPNGYKVNLAYDKAGNLSSKEDNLDRKTTYKYDKLHHLIGVTNPIGEKESYEYDIYDNLTSYTTAGGLKTLYGYDMENQMTDIVDATGNKTILSYDNAGNITGVEKSGNRKITYKYDNNYNLIEEINPMGYSTLYEYDKDNNVKKLTNAIGQSEEYTYDSLNRITSVKDVMGEVSKYAYDAHGNITEYTDNKGNKTGYTYNLNDKLTKVKDANNAVTKYEYDSVGNLIKQTDARGNSTKYVYDAENNLTQITSPDGSIEKFKYDLAGNLISYVYPDGTTIDYDYDKINRLIEKDYKSAEDSASVIYAYDTDGNRISMSDKMGNTSYTYDKLGRIKSVRDCNDNEIHYAYDDAGRLKSITYSDGSKVSYEYDKNDNLIKVSSPSGDTIYTYDKLDRIVKEVRPDKSTTEYTYEGYNLINIVNKDEAGELLSSFVYEYDALGYISKENASQKVIDKDGSEKLINAVRVYEYTDSGELKEFTETQDRETITYAYAYDKAGNRTKLTISGAGKDETIKYEYNSTNRLVSTESNVNGITNYEYDKNGNLISETDEDTIKTYEYTVEQRLAAVREGGTVLMAVSYDGDGNRIFTASRRVLENEVTEERKEEGYNTDETVTYKKKYNAETETVPDDEQTAEISVDNKGKSDNEAVTESEINENDEIKEDSSNTEEKNEKVKISDKNIFLYGFAQESILLTDSLNETEGILISRWLSSTWKFDDVPSTDDTKDNVSDDKNTDEKENEKDTDNINESDGDKKSDKNQDEKKDRNEKCLESAGITEAEKNTIIIPYSNSVTDYKTIEIEDYSLTYYVNDIARQNTQVLMEYGSQKELKNSYIYGNERIEKIEYGTSLSGYYSNIYDTSYTAGSVFAESDNGEIAAPLYNYYIYDGRGSVAQLINEQAELKASYTYDAYGNITYGSNVYESFYGYNAEETSAVTGLEYLRSRYYDTSVGRFNTPDTYLGDITNPQSLNRYAYAENNPVNYVDPSGHVPKWLKKLGKKVKEHAGEIISAVGGAAIAAGVIAAGGPAAAGVAFWAGYTAASKGSSYSVGLKNDKVKDQISDIVKRQMYDVTQYNLMYQNDNYIPGLDLFTHGGTRDIGIKFNREAYGNLLIDDILKLEQQKKELCDKSESLRKQEIIYDKSTMVGINGLSFIVAPYAGQYTSSMIYSQMPMFAETAGYAYPAIVNYTGNAIGYGIQATSSAGMLMNTSDAVEEYTGKNFLRDGLGVSKDVYDSAEETFNTISVYSVITGAVSYQPQQYAVEYPRTNSISSYTGMVNDGVDDSINSSDLVFGSTTKSYQKLLNQMQNRGWTEDLIKDTVDNPYTIRESINKATGNEATVFYTKQGSYVIIDNITKEIVQISDNINPDMWIPDNSIINPYISN